jgi:hypothetical protein
MSRTWIVLAFATFAAMLVLATFVDPALAQQAGQGKTDIGEGIGKLLKNWAAWLIPGVVALVAIPAIARHDITQAASILFVAMLVGGFAFMPDNILRDVIGSIWTTITSP